MPETPTARSGDASRHGEELPRFPSPRALRLLVALATTWLLVALATAWVSRSVAGGFPPCPTPRPDSAACSCPAASLTAVDFCASHAYEILVQPTLEGHERIEEKLEHRSIEAQYVRSLDVFVVRAGSRERMKELANELRPFAVRIEPNHAYRSNQVPAPPTTPPPAPTPNDPRFCDQWSLFNDGSFSGGKRGVDINATAAWAALPKPTPALIGIIDSGVDLSSAELGGTVWRNPVEAAGAPGVDDDKNGWIDDIQGIDLTSSPQQALPKDGADGSGHGTWVASIVAAATNNEIAMAGVDPAAHFIPCRSSSDDCGTALNTAQCVQYLSDFRDHGVNVVAANISAEGSGCSCVLEQQIRKAREKGLLVVASAGNTLDPNNSSSNDLVPRYPASYPLSNVIAVAATNASDGLSYRYGPRTVHLGAPGVRVMALTRGPTPGVTTVDGTSFAAPHVSGVIGLLAANGVSDWRELRNRVLAGGVPVKSLKQKAITGRRLRAWDVGGLGAMTCKGQTVRKRIQPVVDSCVMGSQQTQLEIRVLSINCGSASEPTVEVRTGNRRAGVPLSLKDDGVSPDESEGDGEWTALWTPPARGKTYKIVVRDPAKPSSLTDVLVVQVP